MELTDDQLKRMYKLLVKPALMAQLATITGLPQRPAIPIQVKVDQPTLYTVWYGADPPSGQAGSYTRFYHSLHSLYIPAEDPVAAQDIMGDYIDLIPEAIRENPGLGDLGVVTSIGAMRAARTGTKASELYDIMAWVSTVKIQFG